MNVCKLGLSIAMLLSGGMAFAQGTVDDYNRAYALREKFSANKVYGVSRTFYNAIFVGTCDGLPLALRIFIIYLRCEG
jgi:hypothetical protein